MAERRLIGGEPAPQLMGADLPSPAAGRCAYMVKAPWVAMGRGMTPENTERSCVLTITITAPQHAHR